MEILVLCVLEVSTRLCSCQHVRVSCVYRLVRACLVPFPLSKGFLVGATSLWCYNKHSSHLISERKKTKQAEKTAPHIS